MEMLGIYNLILNVKGAVIAIFNILKRNYLVVKNVVEKQFNFFFFNFIIFVALYNFWIRFLLFVFILVLYKYSIKYTFQIDIFETSLAEEKNMDVSESVQNVKDKNALVLTWTQLLIILILVTIGLGFLIKWGLNITEELNRVKTELDQTKANLNHVKEVVHSAFDKIEDTFQRMDENITFYAAKTNIKNDIIDQLFLEYKNRNQQKK